MRNREYDRDPHSQGPWQRSGRWQGARWADDPFSRQSPEQQQGIGYGDYDEMEGQRWSGAAGEPDRGWHSGGYGGYGGRYRGASGWGSQRGRFSGKGPRAYVRADDRIREEVCEALTDDADVDATDIEVGVQNGEVVLDGSVEDRRQKRAAEECADSVRGVRDVHNRIRVRQEPRAQEH